MKYLLILIFFSATPTCFGQLPTTDDSCYIDKEFIHWFIKTECSNLGITCFQKESSAIEIDVDSSLYASLGLPLEDSIEIQQYAKANMHFKFDSSLHIEFKMLDNQSLLKIEDSLQKKRNFDTSIKYLAISIPFTIKSKNLVWVYANFNLGYEQGYGNFYLYRKDNHTYKLITKKGSWVN